MAGTLRGIPPRKSRVPSRFSCVYVPGEVPVTTSCLSTVMVPFRWYLHRTTCEASRVVQLCDYAHISTHHTLSMLTHTHAHTHTHTHTYTHKHSYLCLHPRSNIYMSSCKNSKISCVCTYTCLAHTTCKICTGDQGDYANWSVDG